jgi:hypothetical protein
MILNLYDLKGRLIRNWMSREVDSIEHCMGTSRQSFSSVGFGKDCVDLLCKIALNVASLMQNGLKTAPGTKQLKLLS